MLAAVFRGPDDLEIEEVEKPEIGPEEVLVEVEANTVCGTDLRILRGEKTRGVRRPAILGHEFAGRVAEVGARVKGYGVGDPVAISPGIPCRRCHYCQRGMENACVNLRAMGYQEAGGLSEYVRIPSDAIEAGVLCLAREDLPPEHLSLAEPLSCCLYGNRRSRIGLGDTVLIMGAGPIGLFHLQLSLLAGADTVIVSEPHAYRREFASRFGAHVVVDPSAEDLASIVSESTHGLGADVVIICIGLPQLVNEALRLARKGGRINVFAGLAGAGWCEVEGNLIHYNDLEVIGNTGAQRSDFELALRLIESGRVQVDEMVTHRFPLKSARGALNQAASGEGLKVAVMPQLAVS